MTYDVGGVQLDRPFKIRRLGHTGFNHYDVQRGLVFYRDLLGFWVADENDFTQLPVFKDVDDLGDGRGYFLRHNGDHHSFALFPKEVLDRSPRNKDRPGTINQITWQVGSLEEVVKAVDYFNERDVPISRSGRDMPGSNWHTYIHDPDGNIIELYYGMEQIGWNGHSKPVSMRDRAFHEVVDLPQISERQEVADALEAGKDIFAGHRLTEHLPSTYEVDGVLLPRPHKIVRLGPSSIFVKDIDVSTRFYCEILGFELTEEVIWHGNRCTFLRCNTEHHSLALYPDGLRAEFGVTADTTSMALGLQLANYRQLRDAATFLEANGVKLVDTIPAELHPGIDHAVHVMDPEGHVIQLYFSMEQVGWDGSHKPAALRQPGGTDPSTWPDTLAPTSDAYLGEAFLGPWG